MNLDLAFVGADIVTPFRIVKKGVLTTKKERIYHVGPESKNDYSGAQKIFELKDKYIVPGFIDLLVHGGAGGYGFSDESIESIEKISNYFLKQGSTSLLASLHAKPKQALLDDLQRVGRYIKSNPDSNIVGIHMEGPYLNPELKGAMNANYLWKPSIASFKEMWKASEKTMKMMTISPELDGALDVIREASFHGVVCSIGHSTASYEIVDLAIDNGAAHVTHMFNAMKPMQHRNPGVATAALLRDELKIQLIADTYHVHPATMEFLMKSKTPKGIVLITDSIRVGGMHEGEATQFSDQKVTLSGNKAVMEDGTIAGSTLTLNRAIKNILETTGAKLTDATRMATVNPAKVIKLDKGILSSGKPADFVVLNRDFDVEMTIMNGEIRYTKLD
ncbi:MAG: N-acetylglucosamine-6-phosphate deacetylase [Ignavibacteriae bacterium]|nr:N-acetylglucosamine-6-phosphate deacetylase [Ignavibacteriota bacterium]MCB9209891.1 N-acetylglucosamine-6-phosphate deacetylase [Ignavibacteriales bacterium]MCB9260281.1 N-acetylglucosamine-6-phosphate deacetylase [Ignavibacteriales bacterium]